MVANVLEKIGGEKVVDFKKNKEGKPKASLLYRKMI